MRQLILPLAVLIAGCGGTSAVTTGLDEFDIINPGSISVVRSEDSRVESNVTGTGVLRFKNPLSGVDGSSVFRLAYEIDKGGSLELLAFASDPLVSGVSLLLSCDASGTISLRLSGSAGNENIDVTDKFTKALGTGCKGDLLVEIHNDETPAHILAWKGDEAHPEASKAFFNSEKDATLPESLNGTGAFWGLNLTNASVTTARAAAAKTGHDH